MSDPYLRKTVPIEYLLVPFFKRQLKYPYYYLSRARYGKWFDDVKLGGRPLDEPDFKRKTSLQHLYARELERDGAVLHEIWLAAHSAPNATPREYLVWLAAQSVRHSAYLSEPDAEPVSLKEFVQSEL